MSHKNTIVILLKSGNKLDLAIPEYSVSFQLEAICWLSQKCCNIAVFVLTLFKIFLECKMSQALVENQGKVSIIGCNITDLHFEDNINTIAEKEEELFCQVQTLE